MEPATHLDVHGANAADWLDRAVACLRAGGVLALPTETFYGLAVDPRDGGAVDRLLECKGYAPGRPLLLLAGSVDQVERLCCWSEEAAALAEAFWPGPLTLVLPLEGKVQLAACPARTLAVRVPSHPVPRQLAAALGMPVTGTSANPAGLPPARTAREAGRYFAGDLGLVLDGGPAPGGKPSTLLDLCEGTPRMLRAGAVAAGEIATVLGRRP